jgi:hypothetical protein
MNGLPPGVLFRGRIVFAEMGVGDIEIVPACWRRADRLMQSTKAFVQGNAGGDDAARDEKEGRPGDYTETADRKTSHHQATNATDYSGGGGHALPRVNTLRAHAIELAEHHWKCRSTARSDAP